MCSVRLIHRDAVSLSECSSNLITQGFDGLVVGHQTNGVVEVSECALIVLRVETCRAAICVCLSHIRIECDCLIVFFDCAGPVIYCTPLASAIEMRLGASAGLRCG